MATTDETGHPYPINRADYRARHRAARLAGGWHRNVHASGEVHDPRYPCSYDHTPAAMLNYAGSERRAGRRNNCRRQLNYARWCRLADWIESAA